VHDEGNVTQPKDLVQRVAPTWGGFVVWAIVGVGGLIGLVSFITPAAVLAGIAILLAVWFAVRRPAFGASAFGAAALLVAFLQRRGPGAVCWHTATASGCDDYLNPWPWLLIGLALVVTGVVLQVRRMRSAA
jgi:hypothetical protein